MYRSLARGPCMEEYATRLERECDNVWKGGRQSCEHISLTGRACRLKVGHEKEVISPKQLRDERAVIVDPAKHNSGYNFFTHAIVERLSEFEKIHLIFKMPISSFTTNLAAVWALEGLRWISSSRDLEKSKTLY